MSPLITIPPIPARPVQAPPHADVTTVWRHHVARKPTVLFSGIYFLSFKKTFIFDQETFSFLKTEK